MASTGRRKGQLLLRSTKRDQGLFVERRFAEVGATTVPVRVPSLLVIASPMSFLVGSKCVHERQAGCIW
jgi:hypothetical protein